MDNMEDSTWLEFGKQGADWAIRKTDRLEEVLQSAEGSPSLCLFIGGTAKTAALGALTAPSSWHGRNEAITLHLCAAMSQKNRPMLFAEGPPAVQGTLTEEGDPADVVEWPEHDCPKGIQTLYARLLGPFTDVVCLFMSDFASAAELADFVASWAQNAHASPSVVVPRLVIVVEAPLPGADPDDGTRALESMIRQKTEAAFGSAFSALLFHTLPATLSARRPYAGLGQFLAAQSGVVRAARIQKQMHFHKDHVTALFDHAYDRLLQGVNFDFIPASRAYNPVPSGAAQQVAVFLKDFRRSCDLSSFVLPVIASAFMLDAFPPQMHAFSPMDVYRTLYRQVWQRAATAVDLKAEAVLGFDSLMANRYPRHKRLPMKVRHRALMQTFARQWRLYRNKDTCLMCLLRRPEYGLPCGHAFCEVDVRRFSEEVCKDTFAVPSCFLCARDTNGARFRFKPATKGISFLSFDGGGVRGVISLQLLQLLELKLKPFLSELPIQNLFDMTVGTSSGGIISLAAVHQGRPISECITLFQQLGAKAFTRRFARLHKYLSKAWNFVVSVCADSLYPSRSINEALQTQFGLDGTLLDYSAATARGAKVAVTATGVPNGEYVITNYNGVGLKEVRHGYRHILPSDPRLSIRTWEAARATSAAPWYFTPHLIKGLHKYLQDGGLWMNNPAGIAWTEAKSLWPNVSKADVALSLGTGYQADPDGTAASPSATVPADLVRAGLSTPSGTKKGFGRFLKRVLDSFLYSMVMDGEKFHVFSYRTNRDTAKRYFRLNVDFPSGLPALDNVGSMETLRRATYRQYENAPVLGDVAQVLLATLFYFELTERPVRYRRGISCRGRILCNIEPGPILKRLVKELVRHHAEFRVAGVTLAVADARHGDLGAHMFQLALEVRVRDLDSSFSIFLRQGDMQSRYNDEISASPFTLRGLLRAQGWHCWFGREDHGRVGPEGRRPGKRKQSETVFARRTWRRITN